MLKIFLIHVGFLLSAPALLNSFARTRTHRAIVGKLEHDMNKEAVHCKKKLESNSDQEKLIKEGDQRRNKQSLLKRIRRSFKK